MICLKKRSSDEEVDFSGEDSEKSSDIETNDEVYAAYHFSSFIPWSFLRNFYISLSSEAGWLFPGLSCASRLIFVELEGEVRHVLLIDFPSINSQETTATTGISDSLPQAVSNPVQSDLESSSIQDLWKRSRERGGKIASSILFQQLWKWVVL